MRETAATVTEIGRRVGCSIATVSRVLNNSARVSPEMREAVVKAMRETQYISTRPERRNKRDVGVNRDLAAKVVELVQYRQSPVDEVSVDRGVVEVGQLVAVPQDGFRPPSAPVDAFFFRKIVDGVVEELSRAGYRAQLRFASDLLDPDLLADINSSGRNGIILFGEYSKDLTRFVGQCRHPLVLLDLIHSGSANVVASDNFAGVSATFNHLYGLGHRRIGFVGRHDEIVAFAERFTMFKLKMAEANLSVRQDWIYGIDEGYEHNKATVAGVSRILKEKDRPSALICANDFFALGALQAAGSLGISVPGQLSVVGFDDADFAALSTPPLTTAHVPLHQMGQHAVRQLLIPLLGGSMPQLRGGVMRLLPELVVRQSTAAPAC